MLWIFYVIWLLFVGFCVLLSHKGNEAGTLLFLLSLPAVLLAPMLVIQRAAAVFVRITYEKTLAKTKTFDYN